MTETGLVGRTLAQYQIVEPLGAGGMGVVYRALDTRLNRSVAIKVLSDEFTADPERKARFFQEARSASAVNHPAIAQIYGVDEAEGIVFIAMELVEGRTARRLVADRELDALGAVEIGIQVAEGLAKAHDAGIVHRDVKSDNIIVTPEGHAKILDFGLAKPVAGAGASTGAGGAEGAGKGAGAGTGADGGALSGVAGEDPEATVMRTLQATQAGMVVGTIGYMSPEQARSRPLDHRSDIFSLGIVLYEMVTGELPFRGESPLDTLHAIAFEETRPVTTVRANLPPSLHRVVSRCLRKRPEDRYGSATEVARDLRTVAKEIDSGITRGIPLAERIRHGIAMLRDTPRSEWIIPAAIAAGVTALLVLAVGTEDFLPSLIPIAIFGLLIYRWVKNRRARLLKGFAKRAAKMDEVVLVATHGLQITVAVREPLAKTYVHLNAQVERINGKQFFGEPFALTIRDNVSEEELRALLEAGGVAYVSDDARISPQG